LRHLGLRFQPVVELAPVSSAAFLIQFIGATTNLFLKVTFDFGVAMVVTGVVGAVGLRFTVISPFVEKRLTRRRK
jgi:hypothetical protein